MTRIGLISDTHNYLDPRLLELFADVDEVWHAGDIGCLDVLRTLQAFKPLRCVYGNADGLEVRQAVDSRPRHIFSDSVDLDAERASQLPEGMLRFRVEQMDVLMTHIGGHPKRYAPSVAKIMATDPPQIFVAGHSHILKVIYDDKHSCLHLNPGACGRYGIHAVRTALKFAIHGDAVTEMQVIELGVK